MYIFCNQIVKFYCQEAFVVYLMRYCSISKFIGKTPIYIFVYSFLPTLIFINGFCSIKKFNIIFTSIFNNLFLWIRSIRSIDIV